MLPCDARCLHSADTKQLYANARDLVKKLAEVPGIDSLTSDLEIASPQLNVNIDRDKAASLGVTANQIESAFYDAYGPRWVSTIYAAVNEYKVLLELAPPSLSRLGHRRSTTSAS